MRTLQGERTVSDLKRLIAPESGQKKTLTQVEPKGRLEPVRGRADWKEEYKSQGGGVASPLVEEDYGTRTRWPARTLNSVDGLLSFLYRPIKSTRQVDANKAEVVNQWAEPQ